MSLACSVCHPGQLPGMGCACLIHCDSPACTGSLIAGGLSWHRAAGESVAHLRYPTAPKAVCGAECRISISEVAVSRVCPTCWETAPARPRAPLHLQPRKRAAR